MEPVDHALDFDEKFYLERYPDVARAVKDGKLESGLSHYLMHGRDEGREPRPVFDYPVMLDCEATLSEMAPYHFDKYFLVPHDLAVKKVAPKKIVIIGSCFSESWNLHSSAVSGCGGDFVLTNNMSLLPDEPPAGFGQYDFQVVQIALRSVMHDNMLSMLREGDLAAHEAAFETAKRRLALQLSQVMRWNQETGILTFVTNFILPQSNPMGRLLPRYELTNPVYFIERLNAALGDMLKEYKNSYLIDIDSVSASVGRRYIQDDTIAPIAHNSAISPNSIEGGRIEPAFTLREHYESDAAPMFAKVRKIFVGALWQEIIAAFRIVRQADPVKLVVVDLDDTLWKGVSGDQADISPHMVEGWPLGVIEALAFLKRRGVLLAIASKNDESRIRLIWNDILNKKLALEDFATVKINWKPKSENMKEILAELNLLPRNVVFIDDNPVERAAMKAAFPDMRILGRYPYYLRRILLWSPETQVAKVTDESSRRTEMIQAQIQRDTARKELSRDEFLKSLSLSCRMLAINSTSDPRFARSFELLNKTNQFNTTGRRWKVEECEKGFSEGMVFHAFEVQDRFVNYGLVGVVITQGREIVQFVMSCRVVGLDIEITVLRNLIGRMLSWSPEPVRARFVKTDANVLCRDVFRRCDFTEDADMWVWQGAAVPGIPEHVELA